MNRLLGKVAIITGGAGGIGAATARRFVEEGAKVLLVDREEAALRELADQLHGCAKIEVADVSSAEMTSSYVARAVQEFGGVDILFANAGTEGPVRPLLDLTREEFERVWAVNVCGVFLGIKYAAPFIAQRGGGSIIITSSIAALVGSRNLGAYVSSKHALTGLARTAALELAAQNIRVNTINPGPIDNRMMRSIEEQSQPGKAAVVKRGFEGQVALGRYGTNEEIAAMALFLASTESSYCTGGLFVADGGYTAQ